MFNTRDKRYSKGGIVMTDFTRREFLLGALGASSCAWGASERPLTDENPRQWAKQRKKILESMELVMGPLPERKPLPLDVKELERDELPTLTRTKIAFTTEEDDRVQAYLLKPKESKGRVPGVLCLHQTTPVGAAEPAGVSGDANLHYALELAERGYVTLAPNYLDMPSTAGFGGYKYDPYRRGYVSTTMKGIWNHMRAVDLLQSLPEVEPSRLACIGHSLGGHNTLFVGVFDTRLKVLVSSCGFTAFAKYMGGDLAGWSQLRYMPLIATKYHNDPADMPFDFSDVLAALAPRPVFVNAPTRDSNFDLSGVNQCLDAARAVYTRIFSAGDRLVAVHPDAAHSFPPAARQEAYEFMDKWLKAAL
jgi:dienelactone hydrolase